MTDDTPEIREIILAAAHTPCSTKAIQAQVCDIIPERSDLSRILGNMKRDGELKRYGNGYWAPTELAGSGRTGKTRNPNIDPDDPRLARARPEGQPDPLPAIEALERRLTGTVERLDLKRQTLERLAQILDPSIGEVLEEIRQDLEGAACAQYNKPMLNTPNTTMDLTMTGAASETAAKISPTP